MEWEEIYDRILSRVCKNLVSATATSQSQLPSSSNPLSNQNPESEWDPGQPIDRLSQSGASLVPRLQLETRRVWTPVTPCGHSKSLSNGCFIK